MRPAREILRDYLERRTADPSAETPVLLREENLRRLLRQVGAAHQPSAPFEARLLAAMQQTAAETARQPRGHSPHRRPWLSRPAWQILVPAAALAAASVVFAWQSFHPNRVDHPTILTSHSFPPSFSSHPQSQVISHPPLVGYVLLASGDLQRRRPDEERWEPIDSGMKLFLGDRLRTDALASGSVVFRDGSICHLYPSSQVECGGPARAGMTRPSLLLLAQGATWNTVEKGGPPLMVRTASATALGQGTDFGVGVDSRGKTTVEVRQGVVELQAAHASVLVRAGMASAALPGRPPQPAIPMIPVHKPPRPGKGHPGIIPTRPPTEKPQAALEEPGAQTFHRALPASPSASGSEATPPGAPLQPSGSSSADSDHPDAPRQPISTSR